MSRKQQRAARAALWGMADYSGLAQRLEPAAHALVAAVDPGPGERVLDVAAGTGNVAVCAAARGAWVVACDLAPSMVRAGRQRSGPAVAWVQADIEELPLRAGCFQAALSAFGVIFAPRPEVVLAQLRRVLAPGGRVGLTAWTTDGCIAARARIVRRYVPPDPAEPDALSWGDPHILHRRLSAMFTDVRIERRALPWHFDSGAALTAFLTTHSAAHLAAVQAAGDRAEEMVAAVQQYFSPDGGPVRLDAEYLLALARSAQ